MSEPAGMAGVAGGAAKGAARRCRAGWWVAVAGLALLVLVFGIQKVWAGDTWGQLTSGKWVAEHRDVPVVDDWSFTAAGRPVREVRWLYCVLMYLGWEWAGPWLVILGGAATLAGMWAVVALSSRRAMGTPAGVLVLGLAVCAGSGRWVLRPELVTYFMIAVFLVALERMARREREGALPSVKEGVFLPAMQALWVNMHSVYVFGPLLAWVFAGSAVVEGVLEKARGNGGTEARREEGTGSGSGDKAGRGAACSGARRAVAPVVVAVLVTAACWVNPYFHRGAMYAAEMWRESGSDSIVAQTLGELRSPLAMPLSRWTWDLWAGAALAAVAAATFVWNRRRVSLARALVFAVSLFLACKAQRHVALLAVMGGWAALRNIDEAVGAGGAVPGGDAADRGARWRRAAGPVMAALGVVWGGVAWYVATDRSWIGMGAPRETGFGVVEWGTPDAAVRFLKESGAPGRLFNTMREGGYLVWWSGGRVKVFVDGRTDVYGDEFLREFSSINAGNWAAITDRWAINTAMVPNQGYEGVVSMLCAPGSGWAPVHVDHRCIVFVREGAAELVAKYRVDPAAAWVPRGEEPDERPEPWKRVIGGPGRPWHSLGMADSFMAMRSYGNAETYLRRGLERWPGHKRMSAMMAALEAFNGRAAESQAHFARLGGSRAWEAYSDQLLARLLMEAGRKAEAVRPLERAAAAAPADESLRLPLADLYFQTGDYKAAAEGYRWCLSRGIGGAGEWLKLGTACERSGDGAGAVAAYRESLRLEPGQAGVENLLGIALGRSGDLRGAAAAFERALKINPEHTSARQNLEAAREAMKRR